MRATVTENRNLINFYNEYPLSTSWDYYSAASFSNETKQTLYPVLKREIAGKSVTQAANMLINFVQMVDKHEVIVKPEAKAKSILYNPVYNTGNWLTASLKEYIDQHRDEWKETLA